MHFVYKKQNTSFLFVGQLLFVVSKSWVFSIIVASSIYSLLEHTIFFLSIYMQSNKTIVNEIWNSNNTNVKVGIILWGVFLFCFGFF